MASPILLFAFVLLLALAAGAGYLLGASSASQAPSQSAELAQRDLFIEHLREVAWQNRDVSPELSTIVIDEIHQHHQRGHRPLPGSD